jgi:Protein of unknown function (DUF2933)
VERRAPTLRSEVGTMEKMLRACLNWKAIAVLALLGLGIWSVAPKLLAAALPVLVLAACPLSMLLMMRGMQGQEGSRLDAEERRRRIAPSPEVRLAELKAEQEAIDREIAWLEQQSEPPAPGPGARGRSAE